MPQLWPLPQEKLLAAHKAHLKEVEAEKGKMLASVQNLSAQLEKKKQSAEEFKQKCWGLEGQLTSVRKVREGGMGRGLGWCSSPA